MAEMGSPEEHPFIADLNVVYPHAAALDRPARLAVRRRETRADKRFEQPDSRLDVALGDRNCREPRIARSFLESTACRFGRGLGGLPPVQQRRRLCRELLLRLIDLRSSEPFQPLDLLERKSSEQPQKSPDVGILCVAP